MDTSGWKGLRDGKYNNTQDGAKVTLRNRKLNISVTEIETKRKRK